MKYIICLGDGMADTPVPALEGKTPLEAAEKPYMDFVAQHGAVGLCKTIPDGMPPGSDVANMSVMGFAPATYYSGRSPLEAVSLGIELTDSDVTFRCNLVTLSDEVDFEQKTMLDYSAGEISTEEAEELLAAVRPLLAKEMTLYRGISYRHCLVMHQAETGSSFTPPHDISGQKITGCLPGGRYGAELAAVMQQSYAILQAHPVNLARIRRGENPANCCWFWGEGTRPRFDTMQKLYGLEGGVICAVDLLRGLGICAGMRTPSVPGATGGMVTNYRGKAEAALQLLNDGCDLVYIHIEAPDECGHHGEVVMKRQAIEAIDGDVLGFLLTELTKQGEPFRVLLCPDHPTPIATRTHNSDPIPFVLYDSTRDAAPSAPRYTEAYAEATGLYLPEGPMMIQKLISGDF